MQKVEETVFKIFIPKSILESSQTKKGFLVGWRSRKSLFVCCNVEERVSASSRQQKSLERLKELLEDINKENQCEQNFLHSSQILGFVQEERCDEPNMDEFVLIMYRKGYLPTITFVPSLVGYILSFTN